LRRPVPRKHAPLFEFLKVGFKPALALKLAAALYQRQVRSIAHVVALPRPQDQSFEGCGDNEYGNSCSSSCSRRRSRNSFVDKNSELEAGPLVLQSALVEAGWLNEPEVQRRLAVENLLNTTAITTTIATNAGTSSEPRGDGSSKGSPAAMLAHMAAEVQCYADKVVAMRCKSRRGKRRYERTQSQSTASKTGVSRAAPPSQPPRQRNSISSSSCSGGNPIARVPQPPLQQSPTVTSEDGPSSDEELSPLVQGRANRESDCGYHSVSVDAEDDDSSSNSESESDSSEEIDSISDDSDASDFDASDDEVSGGLGSRGDIFFEDGWAAEGEREEEQPFEVDNIENMGAAEDEAPILIANQDFSTSVPSQAQPSQMLPTQALPSQVELSEKADVALLSMAESAEPGFSSRLRASPASALLRTPFSGLLAPHHTPLPSSSSSSSSTLSPTRAHQPTTTAPPFSTSNSSGSLSWRSVLESGWRGPLAFAVVLRTAPRDVAAGKKRSHGAGWSGKGSGKGQVKGRWEKSSSRNKDSSSNSGDGQDDAIQGKGKGGKGAATMPSRSLDWKPLGLGKGLLSSYPGDLLPGGRGCAPALDRAFLAGGIAVVVGSGPKDHFFLPLPTPPPKLPPRRSMLQNSNVSTADSVTSRKGYSLAQSAVLAQFSLVAAIAAFCICMPFQCDDKPSSDRRHASHPWYLDSRPALHSKGVGTSTSTAPGNSTSTTIESNVPDMSLLAVNRDWHRAGRRAMIRLLSNPTKGPWALAQRLLESQVGHDHSLLAPGSESEPLQAPVSYVKVANKMQAQASALRQWCKIVTEEVENKNTHEESRLGVVVDGWLADPLVASAMLEAAVPTAALGPMVQAAASATAVEIVHGNHRQDSVAACATHTAGAQQASFGNDRPVLRTLPHDFVWSGAALRGLRVARAALKHMAALEPLLERFQLIEPFALVEMPLIPLLAELSTSGMVLDSLYLRRFREEVEEQKKALQRLAEKVAPGREETWASFGGVAVRKASNTAEVHLGSPKDVSEALEAWNIPTLLRRKNRGLGKSDTKSETLQGYLEDLEARQAAAAAAQRQKSTKNIDDEASSTKKMHHNKKASESWSWTDDALRFLRCVLEYRRLDKLPATLNGLLSYAVKCKVTSPLQAQGGLRGGAEEVAVLPSAYSPKVVDCVVPEVIHAKADTSSKGAGGGSSAGVAALVGLAATGRVSVKPLQHVQKEVTFRRPKYKSLQEELLQRRPQELLRVASRCMVVYAGAGKGVGCGAEDSASHGPLEVRFGELYDISAKQSIADTPAFSDRSGTKKTNPAISIPSVADYWRSKGFPYSHQDAQRVVCVRVQLDGGGGGTLCTYPADQVFRINGSIDFAEDIEDTSFCDDSDTAMNDYMRMNTLTDPSISSLVMGNSSNSKGNSMKDQSVNCPPRTPWCADVKLSPRDVLRASPGRLLLSADFCQVEVRLLAHYSEDPALLNAFAEPPPGTVDGVEQGKSEDFFRRLARHWHKVPPDVPISVAERSAAKEMCYGIIYGAGEGRVAQMLSISTAAARNHLHEFKSRFRDASDFKERVQRDCSRTDMTVRTLLGRQRLVDRVFTQAVNTVIQGSAADIMKVSMIKIHRRLLQEFGAPAPIPKHKQAKQAFPSAPSWVHLERRCRLVNMLHDEVM